MASNNNRIKKKKTNLGKILSLLVIVGLLGGLLFQIVLSSGFGNIINSTNSAFDNSNLDIFGFFTGGTKVKGQDEGRTNIMIYGINEDDGNGEGTVDSNIILSYFHTTKKISTVSFMRDIRVDGNVKINSIYPGLGVSATQNKQYGDYISKLTGVTIHYTAKINMKALIELVDTVGGVEVDIPNTFRDEEYPKYKDYSFKYCESRGVRDPYMCPGPKFIKGKKTMDGKEALIFSRSRKGQCLNEKTNFWYDTGCIENGDDARSRRQQIVIQSLATKLKNDVSSKKLVFDPKYLQSLFSVLGDNITTSLNIAEAYSLVNNIKDNANIAEMKKIVINYQSTQFKKNQLLLCEDSNGSSDLLLCDGTAFTIKNQSPYAVRLRSIIQNPFDELEESDSSSSASSLTKVKPLTTKNTKKQ
jgi:anionic cell wall polymer biosynthesis LytR-Cps2A-Psr (LCP) family protein